MVLCAVLPADEDRLRRGRKPAAECIVRFAGSVETRGKIAAHQRGLVVMRRVAHVVVGSMLEA